MQRYKFLDGIDEKGKQQHLHTLDGKPLIGTTTALGVLSKPLTWWSAGLAVKELGWTNPKEVTKEERLKVAGSKLEEIRAMAPIQYLSLLDKGYRAHSVKLDKSADAGTDMHAELEKYVKLMIADQDGLPHEMNGYDHEAVRIFAEWSVKNVKRFLVSEGHGYSEKLWIGGILDLLYEDNEGRLVILDFKSAKEAYMSHFFQCAGNDIEISENGVLDNEGNMLLDLKGRKVDYYGVFPFGAKNPKPEFYFDTESARKGFEMCVGLHKIINSK